MLSMHCCAVAVIITHDFAEAAASFWLVRGLANNDSPTSGGAATVTGGWKGSTQRMRGPDLRPPAIARRRNLNYSGRTKYVV